MGKAGIHMKKAAISILFLAIMLTGCGQEDETIQEGIIEALEFQKDKIVTAAVKSDYYTMTVNGQTYQLIKSDWENLKIGMSVEYTDLGTGIAKINKDIES